VTNNRHVFFFFLEKEAKSVGPLRESGAPPNSRRSRPQKHDCYPLQTHVIISCQIFFFFQKKKQKALFRFAEEVDYPTLGEADPGGLGAGRLVLN
jgi:hypothetical protein